MKRFLLYCVGGGIAVAVHYLVLFTLVEWYSVNALYGSVLGFIAAIPVNFTFQALLVFKGVEGYKRSFLKYCIVTLTTFCLNALLFYILASLLEVQYLLAQALTIGVILMINFSANSFWTFRKPSLEN